MWVMESTCVHMDTYVHVYMWIQALQLEHRSLHVEQSVIHLTVCPIPSCFSNSIDHRSCCSCFTVVVIFSAVLCLLFISVTLCVDFPLCIFEIAQKLCHIQFSVEWI